MTTMKYKDFIFPHNPRKIEIGSRALTANLHMPGLGSVVQNMGPSCRIITGEGEFFGSGAAAQYAELAALLADSTAGYLFLPSLTPLRAHFTRLTYLGEGDGNIISYRFEFIEEQNIKRGGTYFGESAYNGIYQ